jgi:hypothetical protein
MMRFRMGVSLLASSWLFGLEYFVRANGLLCTVCVALGTLLICWSQCGAAGTESVEQPANPLSRLLLPLAFIPAILVLPLPYRMGPILLVAGSALALLPRASRWFRAASGGVSLSGAMLLAQTLALAACKHFTARSHELPWPLP